MGRGSFGGGPASFGGPPDGSQDGQPQGMSNGSPFQGGQKDFGSPGDKMER